MPESKAKALLKSRRFLVAAAGVVSIVAADLFGVQLDTEQITGIGAIAISWIVGDSIRKTE